jgi:hypothetical protein
MIHVTPIPDLYEISTISLSFIIYLLHYTTVTSAALWKPQVIYPHTQNLYCNAQLVKFMIITSHWTSFKYVFSWHNTQQVQKLLSIRGQQQNQKALMIDSQFF